jgi:ankyrin repeat protein
MFMKKINLALGVVFISIFQMGASCDSELNRIAPHPEKYTLHHAVTMNDMEKVKNLIEQDGVSVNLVDDTKNTPMHIAAYEGHILLIQYLAGKGADLNARDIPKGRTPLHVAAAQSFWSTEYQNVLTTLVDLGADVHAVDYDKQQTALHRAAYWMKEGNVKALINKGANLGARNSEGRTACGQAHAIPNRNHLAQHHQPKPPFDRGSHQIGLLRLFVFPGTEGKIPREHLHAAGDVRNRHAGYSEYRSRLRRPPASGPSG